MLTTGHEHHWSKVSRTSGTTSVSFGIQKPLKQSRSPTSTWGRRERLYFRLQPYYCTLNILLPGKLSIPYKVCLQFVWTCSDSIGHAEKLSFGHGRMSTEPPSVQLLQAFPAPHWEHVNRTAFVEWGPQRIKQEEILHTAYTHRLNAF